VRRWATLLLAALHASTAAAAEWTLPELMQALATVPASQARFTETRHMAVLQAPLVLSGQLAYIRPDQLEKHVLSPYDERSRIRGATVTVENRTRKTTRMLSLGSAPAALALVESLRATLAGDLAALERHYSVRFAGTRDDWVITLAPRAGDLASAITAVRLAGSATRLTLFEVVESGGDRSTMTISEHKP